MPKQLRTCLTNVTRQLTRAGVDSPALCAQLLAGHVLDLDRLHTVLGAGQILSEEQEKALAALTSRRATGEPMAHILGQREFFGRNFLVTPDTLIPRPETELLVETALAKLPAAKPLRFADIGAGCGCIGITLALERPQWQGVLVDNSVPALAVAQKNARALNTGKRLDCVLADMTQAPLAREAYTVLVSNPPYVRQSDPSVMDEVLRFEPHAALFSADQGFAHLRAVIGLAALALGAEGLLLLEHGALQGAMVRECIRETARFKNTDTLNDLAGLERCTSAQKLK